MASKPLSKLQAAMKAKLQVRKRRRATTALKAHATSLATTPFSMQGGQFRAINEKLYTQPSKESFKMMQDEPELFEAVSSGFV